jgi:hypothetical protein
MADLSSEELRQLREALEALTGTTRGLDEETIRLRKTQLQRENDIKQGAAAASNALAALGGAGLAAGKAMLEGQKGASAFNSSLDGLADSAKMAGMALALLIPGGPIIRLFVAGVTAAATATIRYAQEANKMADTLHKGYVGLAKSGAAASDGMSGLYNDAKKLGLSMSELDSMVGLVGENAKELALFSGSVASGRQRFADVGQAMEGQRQSLMNLGMTQQDLNEGTMGYLRLQTRLGFAQNMTNQQLAAGAANYIKEMDALAKLTGQSRKEMEQQQMRALENEQFQAKILELRNRGQNEAADRLMKLNAIYGAAGPAMQSAFQASVTGNLANEDARKANFASNGEMIRSTQEVIAGRISETQAVQRTGVAMKNTADTLGATLGQLGAYNNVATNLTETVRLGQLVQGDINENLKKIKADTEKQAAGADPLVKKQTELIQAQQKANKATEDFVKEGIIPAQQAMEKLARLTEAGAKALDEITGKDKGTAMGAATGAGVGLVGGAALGAVIAGVVSGGVLAPVGAKIGGAAGAALGGIIGGYFGGEKTGPGGEKVPKGAKGGMFTGPTSGYLAMLHGTELVIPESMLKGQLASVGGAAGLVADEQTKIDSFVQEILKDTETLAKFTDADAKRTAEYSRTQKKLIELKVKLMKEEIDILEEQNSAIEQMASIYERVGGSGGAAGFKRMMRMQNMGIGAGGPGAGAGAGAAGAAGAVGAAGSKPAQGPQIMSGTGIGITSGSGEPVRSMPPPGASVPEGQGGSAKQTNVENILAFGDRSGSRSNFEALDDALQNAVVKAAEEYNAITGKKIKINSAARDPADQERIYAESVAAGRPGVTASGMPIGRPGTSRHERGLAVDIQNYNDPQAVSAFNRQGLYQKVPNDPVHFQFENGGIASGPDSGYNARLHGDEMVVPLNNNAGNFVKLFEEMAQTNRAMVSIMDEMLRAQRASVDTQQKMLRLQS